MSSTSCHSHESNSHADEEDVIETTFPASTSTQPLVPTRITIVPGSAVVAEEDEEDAGGKQGSREKRK